MMRPMPFCPSFDPWKKLTPVHVPTISARIGHGGGSIAFGSFIERRETEEALGEEKQDRGQGKASDR